MYYPFTKPLVCCLFVLAIRSFSSSAEAVGLDDANFTHMGTPKTENAELSLLHNESKFKGLDLQQAFAQTLARNPQLYQFELIQKRFHAEQKISHLSPAVNAEFELENFAGSGEVSGVNRAEMTLALSSTIELGGKRNSRTHYVDSRKSLAVLEQKAQTLALLGHLTRQFIRTLAVQESKQLAQDALTLATELVNIVADKALRGASSEAELLRAKAAQVRAKIRVHKLHAELKIHRRQLANYWSDDQAQFNDLDGDLFLFAKSQIFSQLLIEVQQAPATQIYASKARLHDAKIAMIRANSKADVSWRFGVKYFEESGDTGLTGALSMPLANKKRNQSHIGVALAERNIQEYDSKQAQQALATQLYQAYTQREQNIEALRLMRQEAIPSLEQALKLTRSAYENGRYRFQDWVIAQEELLAARQSLIDMAEAGLIHQSIIEQLTGRSLQGQ